MVTTGLDEGLEKGQDKGDDGTGNGGSEEGLRVVLTDENAVLLGWEAAVPEVPRGLPPESWK